MVNPDNKSKSVGNASGNLSSNSFNAKSNATANGTSSSSLSLSPAERNPKTPSGNPSSNSFNATSNATANGTSSGNPSANPIGRLNNNFSGNQSSNSFNATSNATANGTSSGNPSANPIGRLNNNFSGNPSSNSFNATPGAAASNSNATSNEPSEHSENTFMQIDKIGEQVKEFRAKNSKYFLENKLIDAEIYNKTKEEIIEFTKQLGMRELVLLYINCDCDYAVNPTEKAGKFLVQIRECLVSRVNNMCLQDIKTLIQSNVNIGRAISFILGETKLLNIIDWMTRFFNGLDGKSNLHDKDNKQIVQSPSDNNTVPVIKTIAQPTPPTQSTLPITSTYPGNISAPAANITDPSLSFPLSASATLSTSNYDKKNEQSPLNDENSELKFNLAGLLQCSSKVYEMTTEELSKLFVVVLSVDHNIAGLGLSELQLNIIRAMSDKIQKISLSEIDKYFVKNNIHEMAMILTLEILGLSSVISADILCDKFFKVGSKTIKTQDLAIAGALNEMKNTLQEGQTLEGLAYFIDKNIDFILALPSSFNVKYERINDIINNLYVLTDTISESRALQILIDVFNASKTTQATKTNQQPAFNTIITQYLMSAGQVLCDPKNKILTVINVFSGKKIVAICKHIDLILDGNDEAVPRKNFKQIKRLLIDGLFKKELCHTFHYDALKVIMKYDNVLNVKYFLWNKLKRLFVHAKEINKINKRLNIRLQDYNDALYRICNFMCTMENKIVLQICTDALKESNLQARLLITKVFWGSKIVSLYKYVDADLCHSKDIRVSNYGMKIKDFLIEVLFDGIEKYIQDTRVLKLIINRGDDWDAKYFRWKILVNLCKCFEKIEKTVKKTYEGLPCDEARNRIYSITDAIEYKYILRAFIDIVNKKIHVAVRPILLSRLSQDTTAKPPQIFKIAGFKNDPSVITFFPSLPPPNSTITPPPSVPTTAAVAKPPSSVAATVAGPKPASSMAITSTPPIADAAFDDRAITKYVAGLSPANNSIMVLDDALDILEIFKCFSGKKILLIYEYMMSVLNDHSKVALHGRVRKVIDILINGLEKYYAIKQPRVIVESAIKNKYDNLGKIVFKDYNCVKLFAFIINNSDFKVNNMVCFLSFYTLYKTMDMRDILTDPKDYSPENIKLYEELHDACAKEILRRVVEQKKLNKALNKNSAASEIKMQLVRFEHIVDITFMDIVGIAINAEEVEILKCFDFNQLVNNFNDFCCGEEFAALDKITQNKAIQILSQYIGEDSKKMSAQVIKKLFDVDGSSEAQRGLLKYVAIGDIIEICCADFPVMSGSAKKIICLADKEQLMEIASVLFVLIDDNSFVETDCADMLKDLKKANDDIKERIVKEKRLEQDIDILQQVLSIKLKMRDLRALKIEQKDLKDCIGDTQKQIDDLEKSLENKAKNLKLLDTNIKSINMSMVEDALEIDVKNAEKSKLAQEIKFLERKQKNLQKCIRAAEDKTKKESAMLISAEALKYFLVCNLELVIKEMTVSELSGFLLKKNRSTREGELILDIMSNMSNKSIGDFIAFNGGSDAAICPVAQYMVMCDMPPKEIEQYVDKDIFQNICIAFDNEIKEINDCINEEEHCEMPWGVDTIQEEEGPSGLVAVDRVDRDTGVAHVMV